MRQLITIPMPEWATLNDLVYFYNKYGITYSSVDNVLILGEIEVLE